MQSYVIRRVLPPHAPVADIKAAWLGAGVPVTSLARIGATVVVADFDDTLLPDKIQERLTAVMRSHPILLKQGEHS